MGAAGNWRTNGGLYVACELFVAVDARDFGVQPSVREIDTDRCTWFHGGGITEDASAFVPDECVAATEYGQRIEVFEAVGKAMKRGAVSCVPTFRRSGEACCQLVESPLPGICLRSRQQQALVKGGETCCSAALMAQCRAGEAAGQVLQALVLAFDPFGRMTEASGQAVEMLGALLDGAYRLAR